jgi:glycosyltransferase involved in cell wall biosynthesis
MYDLNIFICTYNEEKNIQDCIKCIKQNGYENVFVADSSENELTKNKAEEVGAKVIKAPKGLSEQRQVCIDYCKSEYLMFVDADDRLDKNCIDILLKEMQYNKYDAIQSSIMVFNPTTYWEYAHSYNNIYCLNRVGKTKMVGRPAIYKTNILKKVGMDIDFNGIGNEDSSLSIRMCHFNAKQGIGSGISYRIYPKSFKANFLQWKKYGLGDAMLIKKHKKKLLSIIGHLLVTYPIIRSYILIKNFKFKYVFLTILTGYVRFLFLLKGIFFLKFKS